MTRDDSGWLGMTGMTRDSTKSLHTSGLPWDAHAPPQVSACIVRRGFSRVYFSPIFLRRWQLLITVSLQLLFRLFFFYCGRAPHYIFQPLLSGFFPFSCSVTRHRRSRLLCRILILWEDSWTCPEFKQLWCNAFIPFPRIFTSLNEFVTSYIAGYLDRLFWYHVADESAIL